MRLLLVLFSSAFACWMLNKNPKPDLVKISNKMYLDSLESDHKFYIKQLKSYMHLAIENNLKK